MATVKEIITNAEGKMHKSVDALRVDLASLRAGRATPSLLEKVMVAFSSQHKISTLKDFNISTCCLVVLLSF